MSVERKELGGGGQREAEAEAEAEEECPQGVAPGLPASESHVVPHLPRVS